MAASYGDRPLEALHPSRSLVKSVIEFTMQRLLFARPILHALPSLSLSVFPSLPPFSSSIWFTAIAPVSQSLARSSTITLDIGTGLWQRDAYASRAQGSAVKMGA